MLGGLRRRITMPGLDALLARRARLEAQQAYAAQLLRHIGARHGASSLPEPDALTPPRQDPRQAGSIIRHVIRRLNPGKKGELIHEQPNQST